MNLIDFVSEDDAEKRIEVQERIDDLFDSEDFESVERKIDFERLLKRLSPRDRRIAVLYAFGHTQEEIGAIVGLTKGRVCQILADIKQSAEIRRVNYREENI